MTNQSGALIGSIQNQTIDNQTGIATLSANLTQGDFESLTNTWYHYDIANVVRMSHKVLLKPIFLPYQRMREPMPCLFKFMI